ncbi:MAG TPA: ABC transporter ATP-binding protein [Candidatus Limnocylindria bacterium]|jgi:ABC-2 type transport system ATP-binding protein|nr:ABC transporter ATP-binding protein [Candidatus Limnocylindria bacterium]
MTEAIETHGLTKDYGSGRGIFDLDLSVPVGEVFGFLGPNGAGKTTTIRLLMGLIHATRGNARIFGLDSDRDAVAVKRKVGYCPGELPQFGGWRGSEIVAYVAGLRGDVKDASIIALATRLDLDLGRKYREYSHGNKQKLALVLAFMHQPALVILDEPTTGLDPLHQQEFYGIVRDARTAGATIFISSHVLSEVEHVCDRVGIVRDGHLVTVSALEDLVGMRAFRVEIDFADDVPVDRLRRVEGLDQLVITDHRATALLRGTFEPLMSAVSGARVTGFTSREPSLEEIFLTYYR